MSDKEIFDGFDSVKQKEYEQYLVKYHGTVAEDLIAESKKKTASFGPDEWEAIKDEGNAIYKALADCIEQGLSPRSDAVQALVHQHFLMIERFYTVTKDVYMGLAQLYVEHPGFRKFFDVHHPKLAEFIGEAMRVYALNKLD